ncbi:Uncharacterised protein [Yersinia rohdei]|nr:Uncharacterised protein [Yersinia rohdei]CQJ57015.1 Uncharacterised protein [Yersinia rohdei]
MCDQILMGAYRQVARISQATITLYPSAQQAGAVAIKTLCLHCHVAFREQGASTVVQITSQIEIEIRDAGLCDDTA